MEIYGLGLTAGAFFVGNVIGQLVGKVSGIGGNIGGVGFGMIILIVVTEILNKNKMLPAKTANGVKFLAEIYIPVIVAMAAIQNVVAAIQAGWVAILAGGVATFLGLFVVAPISRIGGVPEPLPEIDKSNT